MIEISKDDLADIINRFTASRDRGPAGSEWASDELTGLLERLEKLVEEDDG